MTVPINNSLAGGNGLYPMTDGGSSCVANFKQMSSLIAAGWVSDDMVMAPGYCEGATAYVNNEARADNPYPSDPEKTNWITGWTDKSPGDLWDMSLCGYPGVFDVSSRIISLPYVPDWEIVSGIVAITGGTDSGNQWTNLAISDPVIELRFPDTLRLENNKREEIAIYFANPQIPISPNADARIELSLVDPADDSVLVSREFNVDRGSDGDLLILAFEVNDYMLDNYLVDFRMKIYDINDIDVSWFLVSRY